MTNFKNVPHKNPSKEPMPDFNAVIVSFLPRSSPMKAPKNGPAIIPHGNINMPNKVPTMQPQ